MQKYRDELLNTVLKAVSFDCVQGEALPGAPFGKGNRECLDYVLSKCESLGFRTKNLDGYCGIADIGEGEPFGILGHLDVVPFGEGWTKNPYGEIDGGVLYGRGVMDDKGPVLACVYAVKALLDEGLKPKRKIRFIFGCNEESGWECIKHYNKVEKMPDEGFSPDADFPVINCEKGIVHYKLTKAYDGYDIAAGERPNVVPRLCRAEVPFSDEVLKAVEKTELEYGIENGKIAVTACGKSAHAATPWEGENAILKLIGEMPVKNDDLSRIKNAFRSYNGEGCGINFEDAQSGKLTVNLGIIDGKDGKLSFTLDIRYPVTDREERIRAELEKQFPDCETECLNHQLPLFVDENDELVRTLLKKYNDVTGENAKTVTIGGGTYARALKKGVAFGPQFSDEKSTIHQPDECVSVDSFMRFTQIYYEAIKVLCF